jgi:hypothetical protein
MFKKHVIETIAITVLLSATAISTTLGPDFQVGPGFKIDTMDNCKSFEIEVGYFHHGPLGACVLVFDL